MFGFSLFKLFVLVVILTVIWYGFKYLGRLEKYRKIKSLEKKNNKVEGLAQNVDAGDMIRCPNCAIYVCVDNLLDCGQRNCPY